MIADEVVHCENGTGEHSDRQASQQGGARHLLADRKIASWFHLRKPVFVWSTRMGPRVDRNGTDRSLAMIVLGPKMRSIYLVSSSASRPPQEFLAAPEAPIANATRAVGPPRGSRDDRDAMVTVVTAVAGEFKLASAWSCA
jgi:hypothetical protein